MRVLRLLALLHVALTVTRPQPQLRYAAIYFVKMRKAGSTTLADFWRRYRASPAHARVGSPPFIGADQDFSTVNTACLLGVLVRRACLACLLGVARRALKHVQRRLHQAGSALGVERRARVTTLARVRSPEIAV